MPNFGSSFSATEAWAVSLRLWRLDSIANLPL